MTEEKELISATPSEASEALITTSLASGALFPFVRLAGFDENNSPWKKS